MTKTVTIKLDYPVQLADRKLTEVIMRRPVVKDMLKHQKGQEMTLTEAAGLLADLCGILPEDIELLDVSDFEKLQNQLLSFRRMAE